MKEISKSFEADHCPENNAEILTSSSQTELQIAF
jgi:hypothetical protein